MKFMAFKSFDFDMWIPSIILILDMWMPNDDYAFHT